MGWIPAFAGMTELVRRSPFAGVTGVVDPGSVPRALPL